MSIVQHIKVLDSQLANIKIVAGSTIYTRDTGKHFIDISDTERVQISDIIYIDTDKERTALLAPLPDKLYITRDTNKVWIYSVKSDKWVCLNIDTTYTAGTGISINGTTINNSGVRAVTAGTSADKINVNTNGNTNTITINNVANATSAGKATNDSAGQQINTTYIKGLSVSGKVITYTKGDGTTGTITTQDTNTWRGIQNVLTSDSTTDSLSAAQGKALKGLVDGKADKATTLAGYGITDAKISDGVITLGSNTITPLTSHQSLAAYAKTADVNTALDKKANKATTLSGYGITDAKISDGVITLGSNTITPLTNHQSLDNYYTKGAVDTLITNLKAGLVNVVESLPTTGENGKLYLVKTGNESENLYTEYVYVNKAWEKLGTQKLDLSGYLTKTDAANTYLGKTAAAASANKLNTNAGSATQPIYFANGVPVATTYTLGKSVPSDAVFTDTVYTHPTTHPASMITGLATVATSGSYADLSDKPTIPAAYSLPDATASVKGGVKIGSNLTVSSGTLSLTKANVTNALGYTPPTTNTTYNDMTAATASTAGTHGLVPAPAAGKQLSFLRGDGTWVVPTNTTYPMASSEVNGIMAASDKAKLDGIAENANNYSHPSSHPASMITGLATVATSGSYNDLTNKPAAYSLPDATASVKGGVKVGSNITVSSGTISLTKANVVAALGYTPPTTDTNTTYSTFKAATASADGGTGLVPAPAKGKQASFLRGDGTWVVPTNTWTAFKGATASAAGTAGYVPAPAAGDQAKFFRADGTWVVPTNTTYSAGTGISLSGTTINNSGVRSVAAGSSANQISVNTNGTTSTITVNNVANAATADKLTTGRTIALSGAVTGSVTFDGSANKTISTTLSNFDASKITTGTIDLARIPKAAIPELKIVADDTARFALTTSNIQNGDTVQVTSTGKMYYVKDQTKLSSEDGYAVYTAGAASSVPWSGVTGKPSSYTPAAHTQAASTITGLATVATSGSYTDLSNKPTIPSKVSQLTNDSGYITGVSWSQVSNKPTSFTPDSLNQECNTITALTGYSKPSSTGAIGTSDSLNAALGKLEKALDGKLSTSGTAAKATQDSAGQQINTTYIKGLSVSGKTITYTKGDGTTGTITTQDTNTTYSAFKGATADAAGGTGLVPAPAKGAQTKYLRADGTWQTPPDTNTTYSVFKAATSSAAGGTGLVPAPAAGAQAKYLRADGTWQTPPDTNTTYSASNGISLSGTTFSNSGVRSIASGSANGTISVNTNGTSADVAVKGLGSAAYTASSAYAAADHSHSNYLEKTTYEYNKEIAFGSTGYLCIGKFPCYDSNITIYVDSTTSTTYHGVLLIATQNINTSLGGHISAKTYGDSDNTLTSSLKIEYINGSNKIGVYFQPQPWSKNLIHIRCNALAGTPTDLCTNIDSIPSTASITPTNTITSTYIKGLSVSGTTITYTKGDGTTGTIKTQDTNTTYNFSGTTFYSGNQNTAEHDANNALKNGHYYYTTNGPATSLGASTNDGGLYVQSYSDTWVCQIAQDYRNGRLFVRGKNNGNWQSWLKVAIAGDIPSSLKNPNALTLSLNGTSQGAYDGSSAKSINITASSIGAATSGHTHDYSASTLVAKTFKTSTGIEIY